MPHYYDRTGKPVYTVKAKNGKERDTDLRDAKKLKLVYGVTDIISKVAKPALEAWKLRQLAGAFERKKQKLDEPWELHVKKVFELYNETVTSFAKEGSKIHDALEKYYKDQVVDPEFEWVVYPTIDKINELEYTYKEPEKSFADPRGFGGKIDLILGENDVIIDFKTKRGTTFDIRDDYIMQLAAYREAINPRAKCFNCFISTTDEDIIELKEYTDEELKRGWNMFSSLLEYVKTVNNYRSEFNE